MEDVTPRPWCRGWETKDESCYWDAESRGNGQGRSFVVDDYGHVRYLPPGQPDAWDWY